MKAKAETATPVVEVSIAAVLADLFPGAPRRLSITAHDVAELIDELDRQWPGMADRIRDSRPAIRRHINIFIDGERATLRTPLEHGAPVFIVTAISGG